MFELPSSILMGLASLGYSGSGKHLDLSNSDPPVEDQRSELSRTGHVYPLLTAQENPLCVIQMEVLVRADIPITEELQVEMVEMGYIVNAKLRNLGMNKQAVNLERAVDAACLEVSAPVATLTLIQ